MNEYSRRSKKWEKEKLLYGRNEKTNKKLEKRNMNYQYLLKREQVLIMESSTVKQGEIIKNFK